MSDELAEVESSSGHAERVRRFTEAMSAIDPITHATLKGHLLIEEALSRIIGKFVFHAEQLEDARLGFAARVALARSMSLDEHDNTMWSVILAVNSLRNTIAHQLESSDVQKKLAKLRALYVAEIKDSKRLHCPDDDLEMLAQALALAVGFLGSFEEEVNRFKEHVELMDRVVNPHRHGR